MDTYIGKQSYSHHTHRLCNQKFPSISLIKYYNSGVARGGKYEIDILPSINIHIYRPQTSIISKNDKKKTHGNAANAVPSTLIITEGSARVQNALPHAAIIARSESILCGQYQSG
jgi:hypothetical protein